MAEEGSISVILMRATDELMTGMLIFESSDSTTLTSLMLAFLSQNWNNTPLNHALVLYRALINDS